ncbi:TetR family transcriptional regulator [Tamaricihabitans halophyticus]|uniref:TetR family transcriptional regulator n=1 Tax=Tamaricihabitans halophyticus TaxID=1262583 RepID=A0A4R2R4L9_9PSEU|nr:TetR/AcrR family transcriptional regulator [Tamaricihabitans halophyticus]TCP56648.1 TetR family transcriptional regulator [Tamaricihabitans halophyticus]
MTAEEQELGRAERKRLQTRERLYHAAVSLFAEHGYDATTMTDIAEHADTARGTAFNHFPTKGAFTLEWTRRRTQEAAMVTSSTLSEDIGTIPRIRAYFAYLASVNERERVLTRNMLKGWLHAEGPLQEDSPWLSQELTTWIATGQDTGEIAPSVDPRAAANLLRDGYLGALYRWVREGDESPDQLNTEIAKAVDLVLAALAVRPGEGSASAAGPR